MDHSSCGEDNEDSAYAQRATGQLSFKKVKRTRMNVDHLTDDEKHLRKRFLGRERARRYRERKRSTESSLEFQRVDAFRYVARTTKPRSVGRPKGSRKKKKRFAVPTSLSKVFTRRITQAEGRSIDISNSSSLSCFSRKSSRHQNLEGASSSMSLKDPDDTVHPSVTCTGIDIPIPTQKVTSIGTNDIIVDVDTNAIGGVNDVKCLKEADSQDNTLAQEPASLVISSEQLACRKMETRVSIMKETHDDDCLGTYDSTTNTVSACTCSLFDAKMRNTDFRNISDNSQKGLSVTTLKQTKKAFKQQNVKDFINFFPVDDIGAIDSKSFVIGSCSMKRNIEYVPAVRRLLSPKPSPRELAPQTPTDHADDVNKAGSSSMGKEDSEKGTAPPTELVESHNVTNDIPPRETLAEEQPVASSVESSLPQASAPGLQASLSSLLPMGNIPVPLVLDSTSTQPLTMVGLPLQQTLQDVQLSGLLQQQQLINTATANIQALNTSNAAFQSSIVGTPDHKVVGSLQGIVGLQNLQGLGGNQGIPGIQSVVGTSSCLGLQEVTDPRLFSLTGLQGVGVLPNITSLQGFLGGLHGIPGLQGVAGLQGVGCLQGITGPISPTGLAGLQGIQSIQAVPGLHGIPGLQAVTGLQGLVSLPGVTALPGVQSLQGIGIVGSQAAQGLQAVAALQGNAYLQGITGVQGTTGLIPDLPIQPGVFGQLGLSATAGAVSTEVKQDVTCEEVKDQGVASSTGVEGVMTNLTRVQSCNTAGAHTGEQSTRTATSSPTEPKSRSTDAVLCTPEKLKGRSRRKQASPRCISKQQRLSFDSKDGTEEEEDDRYVVLKGDNSQEEAASSAANTSQELKTLGPEIASTSQTDGSVFRSSAQAKMESPRPGTKLSKKVEELISATKPLQLGIDCSSSDPVDDESPSPQTWKRFLERERQRNDRLREVEEQLARLQAISFNVQTAGLQASSPKSLVSMATQTDSEEIAGNQDRGDERILRQRENFGQMLRNAEGVTGQAGGNGIPHGQIQQGVVTSSGDSLGRTLSSDTSKNKDETAETAPVPAEDILYARIEMPLLTRRDTKPLLSPVVEAKIINRPSNIWLHSYKRKRKVSGTSVKSMMPHLAEVPDGDQKRSSNEELNKDRLISASPKDSRSLLKKQKKTKYVYQIPLNDIGEAASVKQAGEALATMNDNGLDRNLENYISPPGRFGDVFPRISLGEQIQGGFMAQPHSVLPWEVHGLSKIERNRIRAREGMRRHREKLRQAKLACQTWLCSSVAPESPVHVEAAPLTGKSGMFDATGCLPEKVPSNLNTLTFPRQNDVIEKTKCKSDLKCIRFSSSHNQKCTTGSNLANAKALQRVSLLKGQNLNKKPFEVLTRVAASVESETTADIKPETKDLSLTHGMEHFNKTKLKPSTPDNSISLPIQSDNVISFLETGRIDFTQEPYKSMSLPERNRIRAREGMRRYRERIKLARLSSQQLPKFSFVKPHAGRVARKQGIARNMAESSSFSDTNKVAAAEHLVELAKRHTKSFSSLPSYSEMLQLDKVEALKRRRAASLVRTSGKWPRPKTSRSTDKQLFKTLEISSNVPQDSTSGEASSKGSRIMFIKSELFQDGDSKQSESHPKLGQVKYWSTTRERHCTKSETSSLDPSKLPISDELPKGAERKRLKSEKRMRGRPDMALRKRYIEEKVACGMDRYAAISSSAVAEKHTADRSVAAALYKDEQATDHEMPEEKSGVERPLCQDHGIINAATTQPWIIADHATLRNE